MGLGNPGRKYRETRHNVGRVTVERLLESSELIAEGKWQDGQLALAGSGHRRFLALKPETYMNNSGRAVAQ
ncbi:MAG: aminoacyl-tRNA hydrolase, partial [Actinobacteria bacterium]|nr:aminoacyl-tRNA hydrolase [Actinomycetota bacterium]